MLLFCSPITHALLRTLGDSPLIFDQRIDHFGGEDTFEQRYLYTTEYAKTSEAELVIIDVRGETDKKEMSELGLDVRSLAVKTKSIVATLEHRFYGDSLPLTSSTTTDLFNLLTVKQAIADLVSFREYLIEKYGLTKSKFVLMGCSYAGSLAAWARVLHPDLFLGAIASCPVINLKYDFPEYLEAVGAAYANQGVGGSPKCKKFMKEASMSISLRLASSVGRRELETIFELHSNYLEDLDTRQLWSRSVANHHILQVNDPFCERDLCNIEKKCNFIANSNITSDRELLRVFIRVGLPQERPDEPDYEGYISWLQSQSNDGDSPGSECPFIQDHGILGNIQKICQDAFGLSEAKIKQRIDEKKQAFANLKNTNNIFVILGELDPWKAAGEIVTSDSGPTLYKVPKASHCYWVYDSATELDGINEMFAKTVEMVESWLKADHKELPESSD